MKYVIIGVGAAGIKAASEIRNLDKDATITMVSKDQKVHSRCMLHFLIAGERDEKGLCFIPDDYFEENRIDWIKEAVTSVDGKNQLVKTDKQEIAYDKLLIATGSNSFIPPVPGFREAVNVHGLRHLSDAQAINEELSHVNKVVIIGSGLVGLDAAYGLLRKGKQVEIVEMGDRILPVQLDAHAAKAYQELFETAGATFHLSAKASGTVMNEEKQITDVVLDDGTKLSCDMLIVTAGVRSAVEFLEDSGIFCDRGIKVNDFMETNVPNIYAAGDVTGLSGIWPNAQKQGKTAADNMCGIKTPYEDKFAVKNTINFYGLNSLCVGLIQPEKEDMVLVKEDKNSYNRIICRENKVVGVLLQGDVSHAGIWQYLIKNEMDIPQTENLFKLNYGMFYHVKPNGEYSY